MKMGDERKRAHEQKITGVPHSHRLLSKCSNKKIKRIAPTTNLPKLNLI